MTAIKLFQEGSTVDENRRLAQIRSMERGDWDVRRYRIHCICVRCNKLRIVTPLYRTSKQEREQMKVGYVCSDCE